VKSAKTVTIYTLFSALEKVRAYCAYQERSQQEVRSKLYSYKLTEEEVEQGITVLIEEGFINEERFAMAYAGGKFRIKKWGKVKIKTGLKMHNISEYCISKALKSIKEDEYMKALARLLEKKLTGKKKISSAEAHALAGYAYRQGFESQLVWEVLKSEFDFKP